MDPRGANKEIFATEQRRMRMAKLMAETYKERVKRLEAEVSKLKDKSSKSKPESSNLSGALSKTSAALAPLLTSIESSLEKQARFISDMDEKIARKVYLPTELSKELAASHIEPKNGLMFACSLLLSAAILAIRAFCM